MNIQRIEATWQSLSCRGRANSVFCSLLPSQEAQRIAFFFPGDNVEGIGDATIDHLSKPEVITNLLLSKLGWRTDAWVVYPPYYQDFFAIYKHFLPCLTTSGEPLSYNPSGLPATTHLLSSMRRVLRHVNQAVTLGSHPNVTCHSVKDSLDLSPTKSTTFAEQASPLTLPKPVVLFGFSKGGIVVNQILVETTYMDQRAKGTGRGLGQRGFSDDIPSKNDAELQDKGITIGHERILEDGSQLSQFEPPSGVKEGSTEWGTLPDSVNALVENLEGVHFVDVGLNTTGAYITDECMVNDFVNAQERRGKERKSLNITVHGTPRQWSDHRRPWIREEKDRFISLLETAIEKSGTQKLSVVDHLYFEGEEISLRMHFRILEALML